MIKINKIIYIAGLHGDESAPLFALTSQHISVIAGNPKALLSHKRFIDSDLNASFGLEKRNYEFKRAKELLKLIPQKSYVVDFHTTTAKTEPFVIIVDQSMIRLAQMTGLKYIVIMKHNIKKGHALINYRKGISIETGNHGIEDSMTITLSIVHNISNRKIRNDVRLFEVFDKITKFGKYSNFKYHQDGFFPVLAGEKAYPFFGLKAKEIK